MDQILRFPITAAHGHLQGSNRQFRFQCATEVPPDHPSGVGVQHNSQVNRKCGTDEVALIADKVITSSVPDLPGSL
jgi:hypothetical protein